MERDSRSHKGQNGKTTVVGGSRHMHGAPLFAALAAEAAGADLLYACVPACHEEAAKQACLNLQVHPFAGDELSAADRQPVLELLATMDSAVLGPGIGRQPEQVQILMDLAAEATCTLVLDATALQPDTLNAVRGRHAVLTPHLGELERMGLKADDLSDLAQDAGVTFLLKGPTDTIAGPDGTVEQVSGGNAGLTTGGTGDVLAGTVAGLLAQGEEPVRACVRASTAVKKAAETLYPAAGPRFTARDVIAQLPALLGNA